MGSSSSQPSYAPDPLPKRLQKLPSAYAELRNPNGSVVHVLGVRPMDPTAAPKVREVIRAAVPDSVLLQLCDERVAPVWELVERGAVRKDGSVKRPLPALDSYSTLASDARFASAQWWLMGGLEGEGLAALQGTCLGAAQAAAAHEAARLRAQTHLVDRRVSCTLHRCVAAVASEALGLLGLPSAPPAGASDLAKALDVLLDPATVDPANAAEARPAARDALDVVSVALASEPAARDTRAAAAFAACAPALGDERSEILAHRCWEATNALGPGGVAVAVVGAEHVPHMAGRWMATEPKEIEGLLGGPGVGATLAAATPPVAALGALVGFPFLLPRGGPRVFGIAMSVGLPLAGLGYLASGREAAYRRARDLQPVVEKLL
mmetsp:Transcript_21533/g.64432  ORF Transcript_21533/g.64432 Transcript_21533/m.64432 type:complete len:379 (+) Transcript_21533:150-1286(+)